MLKRDDESFSEDVEHGGQLVTRDRDFNAAEWLEIEFYGE